jgi:CDGSH-type Zn-finger protein
MTERTSQPPRDEPDEAPEGFREQPRYAPTVERAYATDRIDHTLVRQDIRVALCRCGASANKPFGDGSHRTAGFRTTRGPA